MAVFLHRFGNYDGGEGPFAACLSPGASQVPPDGCVLEKTGNDHHIESIDLLRGIAALGVAWFHLSGLPLLDDAPWVKASGAKGPLGVQVFFVISGFVLPYSMHRSGYRLRHLGKFLAKRIVRLDPPYLLATALEIALWNASSWAPGWRGVPYQFEPTRLLMHLGYLNAFFGYEWYIGVCWSLAVEFQFYLLVALTFPLIAHKKKWVRSIFLVLLACCSLTSPEWNYILHWLGLFALGMACFQTYCGLANVRHFVVLAGILTAINLAALGHDSVLVSAVALTAAIVIGFVRVPRIAPLAFLGKISYSFYLLHCPIGWRVMNLGSRFVHSLPGRLGLLVCGLTAAIAAAYVMYQLVERPAQRWSAMLRYRRR